ncbi:MAG: hypothetical protein WCJ72_09110 [Chryseobacterium sp.]|jgi:predicted DNA-binding transcriptional regulator AlpA
MNEYDFSLEFKLEASYLDPQNYLDQLYEAGCDDALISVGKLGYISLDFIRESNSAKEAIETAINNIKSVLTKSELIYISPDLVGVREIADFLKCSRQNIQKFVNKDDFPYPISLYNQKVWHLSHVLKWFNENDKHISPELLELSILTTLINNEITQTQVNNQDFLCQAKDLVSI